VSHDSKVVECPTCGSINIIKFDVGGFVPITDEVLGDVRANRAAHGMCPACGLPPGYSVLPAGSTTGQEPD
jgi:hypothetical protein